MKVEEHKVVDVIEIEFPAILHKIKSIKLRLSKADCLK